MLLIRWWGRWCCRLFARFYSKLAFRKKKVRFRANLVRLTEWKAKRNKYKQMLRCYNIWPSVDQNKGIWGSYNHRSTTNQPRSQRCQSWEGSVICDIILRRESSKHCYISKYLETWREPGPTQAGLTIAGQSRINREPIADFIDIDYLKIELIWVVRLWTLLFWFFFALGYHYWTRCLGKPNTI